MIYKFTLKFIQNQPLARFELMAGLFLREGVGEVRAGGSGTSGQCIAVFAPCLVPDFFC